MKKFEDIIKKCLKNEFKDRVEKYYYFDAKDYIKPDYIELESEIYNERKYNNDGLKKLKRYCGSENRHNSEKGINFYLSLDSNRIKSNNEYALEFYNKYLKENNRKITEEDIDNVEKFYEFERNKPTKEYIEYLRSSSQSNTDKLIEYYNSKLRFNFKYNYTTKLVLLFVFNNIKSLCDLGFVNLNHAGFFSLALDEEIIKTYLDNRLEKYKGYSDCNCDESKYIFYIKDKVTINLIDSIARFLKLNLDTSSYYYRGHSKVNYKLIPSAFRDENFDEKEQIDEVCAEYPGLFDGMNKIDVLNKIQHYGGKTRLLDITENPLVAMYFACSEYNNNAGEVIILKKDKGRPKNSDTVSLLSSLSFIERDEMKVLKDAKDRECDASLKLEHLVRQERIGFKMQKRALDGLSECIYYNASKTNDRIIRQSGRFILCGIDIDKVEEKINDFRKTEDNSDTISIYIVCNKRSIIKELEGLRINYHYLFPELENYFNHNYKQWSTL